MFYQIGLSGFTYILSIIIADTSSLKNRALAFAFSTSPSLITTFIGPPIARWFYEQSSWRWAFGFSSISFLLLSLPILVVLMKNAQKAAKLGVLPTSPDVKVAPKSLGDYLEEFDGKADAPLARSEKGCEILTFGFSYRRRSAGHGTFHDICPLLIRH